jgi:PAS domain S-box-containing protein
MIRSVLVTRQGELWIGTSNGAGVFDGRKFDRRGSEKGLPGPSVRRIVEDAAGRLWFCCDRWPNTKIPGGLAVLDHGQWRSFSPKEGIPSDHVVNFFEDSNGRQFVLTNRGVAFRKGGMWQSLREPGFPQESQSSWQMLELPDRRFFLQQWDRLLIFEKGKWRSIPQSRIPWCLTREGELLAVNYPDIRRSFWFGRWESNQIGRISAEISIPREFSLEMVRQAPDGSLWCIGRGVLLRWQYRSGQWRFMPDLPPPLQSSPQGQVWFGDQKSVQWLDSRGFHLEADLHAPLLIDSTGNWWGVKSNGLIHKTGQVQTFYSFQEIGVQRLSDWCQDKAGHLWVAGTAPNNGILISQFDGKHWQPFSLDQLEPIRITSIALDPHSGIWVTLEKKGLNHFQMVQVTHQGIQMPPEIPLPPLEAPRLGVDEDFIWLMDYEGLYRISRKPLGKWVKEESIQFEYPQQSVFWKGSSWFFFTGGSLGRWGIASREQGRWNQFPLNWRGQVSAGQEAILLPSWGGFYLLYPDGREPGFVGLPANLPVNRVVESKNQVFWVDTIDGVFRYQPDPAPPGIEARPQLTEVRQDRTLTVELISFARFQPRLSPLRHQFCWRLDHGPWSPFTSLHQHQISASSLSTGEHLFEALARDPFQRVSSSAVLVHFKVLPVPLQERHWFWPATAALGLLLASLTFATWSSRRRLARYAVELEDKVSERTRELKLDIQKRQQVEADLRQSEQRFQSIFDSANDAIILHEEQSGQIINVNRRMTEMYGYSYEEALRLRAGELSSGIPPYTQQDAQIWWQKATTAPQLFEWQARHKDGSLFWVEINMRRAKVDGQNRILVVVRNVDDRKVLEERLRQAQKMEAIGTLAGGIAHDFNNILMAILPYAEMAKEETSQIPQVQEYLDQIQIAADRARQLVQQILAFSRTQPQQKKVISLASMILEVLGLLRPTLPATVEILADLSPDAPTVEADASQMHQLLINLCMNAVHAMEGRPGRLSIQLAPFNVDESFCHSHPDLKPGLHVQLTVHDTGHGIDATTLKRIFDPFFTTKPTGEGTGLGLAMVHGIVLEHQGDISVYSSPGQGTSFQIFLPACSSAISPATKAITALPTGRGERILFLDDEISIGQISLRMLQKLGYQVTVFENPVLALDHFRAHPEDFDLIVTDLTMPGMTGVDFALALRQSGATVPILLTSGFGGQLTPENVQQWGIQGLLIKPFTREILAETIATYLHHQG